MATGVPQGFTFNPDQADLEAAPLKAPVVFDSFRVPCQCGRHFPGLRYEFFPTTIFIHGECPSCGPRTAIFAPPLTEEGQQAARKAMDATEAKLLDDFLTFVQRGCVERDIA